MFLDFDYHKESNPHFFRAHPMTWSAGLGCPGSYLSAQSQQRCIFYTLGLPWGRKPATPLGPLGPKGPKGPKASNPHWEENGTLDHGECGNDL